MPPAALLLRICLWVGVILLITQWVRRLGPLAQCFGTLMARVRDFDDECDFDLAMMDEFLVMRLARPYVCYIASQDRQDCRLPRRGNSDLLPVTVREGRRSKP
eukprot:c16799_g1_i2 orf=198-506(+)